MKWGAAALSMCLATLSCGRVTQIVLVIDTDMTVPADMDHLDLTIAGAVESKQLAVDLATAGSPMFPLTLGLTPGNGTSTVTVTVLGTLLGGRVAEQTVRTVFVAGESKMLRLVLAAACLPIMCSSGLTCDNGSCLPTDRPGTSLPPWLGTLPPRPDRPPPTPIQGRTVWSSGWHSAAVEGTALYGWGQNSDGQVGNGNTQNANARRVVMNLQSPMSVGLGQLHSCVCDRGGQAFCWGRNADGQLGTGDTTPSLTPVQVPGVNDCQQIAGGGAHTCVLRTGGVVSCWGNNSDGQTGTAQGMAPVTAPTAVAGLTDVVQVQCGEKYSCARRSDGSVVCWGDNAFGQLGDGTMTDRSSPIAVSGLGDIVEVAAGRFFACALRTSGQVTCWGRGGGGVLGTTGATDSAVPLDIAGLTDAVQLAAGQAHACAIRKSGVLSCWGGNAAGQLGNGTTTMSAAPVDVLDIEKVTSIAVGSVHTCARHSMGLACWGENIVNQLGDGSTTNRSRPVSVAGFL